MSKHTPGPWTVGNSGGYLNQLKIEPTIGVVYGAGEEIQANAHLIAAAPDLLEALEMIVEDWEATSGDVDRSRAYVETARSALAKARGE